MLHLLHTQTTINMNKQFVIVTKIIGKTQYIQLESSNAATNKHIVNYSTNKDDATVFDSFKEAETFKDKISNPFHRVFTIEYL